MEGSWLAYPGCVIMGVACFIEGIKPLVLLHKCNILWAQIWIYPSKEVVCNESKINDLEVGFLY